MWFEAGLIDAQAKPRRGARKLAGAAMIAATLGLCGCLGTEDQIVHGYQLSSKTAEQVKIGASAEQILVLLGTPTTTSTVGGSAWYYISQTTSRPVKFMPPRVVDQRVFAIYFDKTNRVQKVGNYGLEDGKVFDFVSRTTPTAGAEANMLKGMLLNLLKFG
jgi:outer membrane protein assembly factor BamE (lipoprotein component of BamABCDE complex)